MNRPSFRAVLGALFLCAAASARAQQPFATDDAEVAALHQWHVQYSSELAVLQKSASPNLRQHTSNFVVQYGLFERVEVNVDFPLLAIENSRGTSDAFGLGDLDLAVKWKLMVETPFRPAFTVNAAVEFPTGNEKKQLGSGLTDYALNTVLQKTFSAATLHLNAGVQFVGNTETGVVGLKTPGRTYSAGLSATRVLSRRLLLGLDVNGAEVHKRGIVERALQLTAGGSYGLLRKGTLDFAVFTGWFENPRVGFVLGVSLTP